MTNFKKSLRVVGGSTAEGYGVDPQKSFGFMASQYLQYNYVFNGFHMLRINQVIPLFDSIETSEDEVVIVMVGLADGWLQPRGVFLKLLPQSWRGDGKLNPATRHSRNLRKRIKQKVRHSLKFAVKLVAWSTKLYRSPTPLSEFRRDFIEVLELLKSRSVTTIFMIPQRPRRYSTWLEIHAIERYTDIVREIVDKNGNSLIWCFDMDEQIDSKNDLLLDGLHLNERGHEKIALSLSNFIADGERY